MFPQFECSERRTRISRVDRTTYIQLDIAHHFIYSRIVVRSWWFNENQQHNEYFRFQQVVKNSLILRFAFIGEQPKDVWQVLSIYAIECSFIMRLMPHSIQFIRFFSLLLLLLLVFCISLIEVTYQKLFFIFVPQKKFIPARAEVTSNLKKTRSILTFIPWKHHTVLLQVIWKG